MRTDAQGLRTPVSVRAIPGLQGPSWHLEKAPLDIEV